MKNALSSCFTFQLSKTSFGGLNYIQTPIITSVRYHGIDGTSSRRDFKPKLKLYKHLKTLFYHL